MTYDAADGYLLSFGGYYASDVFAYFNTTWELRGGIWDQIPTTGSPPRLADETLTYDAADGYVVLLGVTEVGNSASLLTPPVMETWAYHAGVWTELHPTAAPSLRTEWSMAYDANDGYVVVFGGFSLLLNSTSGELNDTWEFLHGNWSQLSLSLSPPARWSAGMTYDAADGSIFLADGSYDQNLGGDSYTNSPVNDAWEYSRGTWRNLTRPGSLPADASISLAYDPLDQAVLLYCNDGGNSGMPVTWEYRSGTWTVLENGTTNAAVSNLVYDPDLRMTLLFGGEDPNLYGWNGSEWVTVGGVLYLQGNSVAYDAADGYVMAFALTSASDTNSTYEFDGSGWTPIEARGTPPARAAGLLAYDAADRTILLFGGENLSGAGYLNDTWTYSAGLWTRVRSTESPLGDFSERLVYDPARRSVLLLGAPPPNQSTLLPGIISPTMNVTWEFAHGEWSTFSTPHAPSPRAGEGVAYDPSDGWLVLFGGDGNTLSQNDTWAFNGTDWFELTPSQSPPGGVDPAFGYDPALGGLVLHGGEDGQFPVGNTWVFAGGEWAPIASNASSEPPASVASQFVFDPAVNALRMFGGEFSTGYNPDAYDGDPYAAWTFLPPPLVVRPYPVLFRVQGLPHGDFWSVVVGNATHSSNSSVVSFGLANGTYAFSIDVPTGLTASPSAGSVLIDGGPLNRSIAVGPLPNEAALILMVSAGSGTLVALGGVGLERRRRNTIP